MKKNIFGTINHTAGQNLMSAVEGCDQQIGIPPYNYGKALDILTTALTTEEYEIVCRGYGFNHSRQKQYEIAKDLGISDAAVSVIAHKAIRKLQGSPYRVQLRSLAPTAEELFDTVSKLEAAKADSKALRKQAKKLEGLERRLEEVEGYASALEVEKARLVYEVENLRKQLAGSRAELDATMARVVDLASQVDYEKARTEAASNAYGKFLETIKEAFAEYIEQAREKFVATISDADVSVNTLERLHLSNEMLTVLRNVGLKDLKDVCNMTSRGLRKVIGKKHLEELERALAANGLSLKAG